VAVVDRFLADEAHELDSLFRLELEVVDLRRVDQDIFALLVFVALGDRLVLDRSDAGHDLLVADALAGRLVDLVELDAAFRGGGGVEFDRNVDQGKPQMAGPERAGCHTRYSLKPKRCRAETGPEIGSTVGRNRQISAKFCRSEAHFSIL